MNYTDVDDKIIMRAQFEERDPFEISQFYIDQYGEHLKSLNVLPASIFPRVSTEIEHIIEMISGLIEKGYAYASEGDVYFRVQQDDDYGRLSNRKLEDMQAGARIDIDERKDHPMDFALWKSAKEGEPFWGSPWGNGRPGWHIECSAMSLHHLGEQIDIHGGGNDLIFPHHENEIAQTESFTGHWFARYWVHNGMMQLGGEKMSKSLGNLVTIEQFLADHEADVLRLMVLNSNYRSPLRFSDEIIEGAAKGLERLRNGLRPAFPEATGADTESLNSLADQVEKTKSEFTIQMDDDFNSAGALGHIFDLVRVINQARDAHASAAELAPAQDLLRELTVVFGLDLEVQASGGAEAAPFIEMLLDVRKRLRDEKKFALSDLIRDQLAELGVTIEDSKAGATWRWSK
jgi:cysteinyl-tRNA synthetase